MWETRLEFTRPGLQTSIQDMGREGRQSQGVPRGGVMDTRSMLIANSLVGNAANNPILEIALIGPKIKVTGDAYIAVTGAPIDIKVNGVSSVMYETLHIQSGSTIELGAISDGARSYLAINGAWKIDRWQGSCSPLPIINPKSLLSNQILKNSKLIINTQKLINKKNCPPNLRFRFDTQMTLSVLQGPEFGLLSSVNQKYFFESAFTIHKNSNRMAVSMIECIPNFENEHELISSANLIGTIQLTKEGQPMILMNDGGTTGGYPRIANVITVDLPKIAQLKTGQKIKFQLVDLDFAVNEYKKEKELLLSIA